MITKSLIGQRILLVDDDPGVRESLALVLKIHGADVTQAEDGQQGLELYRQHSFDAVVTDLAMPRMSGDALAQVVKTVQPTQRIVMVSAFVDGLPRNGELPWYLDALCPKPCEMSELVEASNARKG